MEPRARTIKEIIFLFLNIFIVEALVGSIMILVPAESRALSLATQEKPYYSSSFYAKVKGGLRDQDLVQELHDAASKNHRVLGYDRARVIMMGQMYLEERDGEYAVHDVYCLKDYTNRDFSQGRGVGPDRIPDGSVLNTEHTWPQSRFSGKFPRDMQKSDLHHLFPSDSQMNSSRGNFKFGEVRGTENLKCDTARLGQDGKGFRFEPPTVHKGNVARALFYFSIRYGISIDQDEEVFLRKWHNEDPVDQEEVTHHEQIFQAQGNRNPFIDHPELASEISDF